MKLICIGRNYAQHIAELANDKPKNPVVFLKPESAILAGETFLVPSFSNDVHYEVEVLVKISKMGKNIEISESSQYYDEIGLGIDFTARDIQQQCKDKGLPWEKAKAFDGSAVVGDFYPKREFDVKNISFQLFKNDQLVQDGNTAEMLWEIGELIAYVSQYFTLQKGDVIFTGTPAGVGKVAEHDVLTGKINGKTAFQVSVSE